MRMGTSQDSSGKKVFEFKIVEELRGSGDDFHTVPPFHRFAYEAVILAQNLSPFLRNRLYGPENVVVADATAEVAREGLFDLFFAGMRIFFQKGF